MTTDAKRDELREKIEAAEARNEARTFGDFAREAGTVATDFVKERPLTAVAGVAATAIVIGAMFPAGRRAGRQVGQQVGTRAASLATVVAELAAVYGAGLLDSANDAARTGQDKLEDIGDTLGQTARGLKRDATYRAETTSENVRGLTRRAGRKTSRAIRDLKSRVN